VKKPTCFSAYYEQFRSFKKELFGLYTSQGAVLERKAVAQSLGTTWGYWLAEWNGRRPMHPRSSASIGEDEVRLFYDICQIVQPECSYIIGNSFGLSTLCLALAWPAGVAIAIDNWGDVDTRQLAKPLFEQIVSARGIGNVYAYSETSPQDTPEALKSPLRGDRPLSLCFIDGLHRNPAALEDFRGALPFLDHASVVLWHNINDVAQSFEIAYQESGRRLFDQHHVLRTHGPMGIDYSSEANPTLHSYLRDFTLIWRDWARYVALLEADEMLRWRAGRPTRSLPRRIASSVGRRVRSLIRTGQ
jgi:predicted O-methyltransferase YrrM